jgi:LPXTG-motif cell wall-anchored protein
MPVPVEPVPSGVKNRYAFDFAIHPGDTEFVVVYRMPYSGSYEFSLTPESSLSELGVLLPKNMKFTGVSPTFARDRDEAGQAVYFAKDVPPNQTVKFSVTGPGSGTAAWIIIGTTVLLIAGGGLLLWRRSAKSPAAMPASVRRAARMRAQPSAQPAQAAQGEMLDVLKDELFQLETDRLSGKITQEEYEKTKAGLDTLFRRQMKKR